MKADTVGGITPAVLVQLRDKEKILAAHEIMLHMDGPIKLARKTMKQLGVSRTHLMGMQAMGDSEESYFFAEFEGPGNVTFSRDKGGEVRVLDLVAGQTVRLRAGHLICFDETVRYYPMVLAKWVIRKGNEQENEYLFVDELTGPGTIVFQSFGNILSFTLNPGEALRTSTEGLLLTSQTNPVQVNWPAAAMGQVGAGPTRPVLDVAGPGLIMVHSGA